MELHLPVELPVMTLPEAVFFPKTVLPLRIFEPRYRQMLKDVLASHRMFGVVALDPDNAHHLADDEPPHAYATAGIVHTCKGNADGTSELLLHGMLRVRILRVLREEPYRVVEIEPALSEPGAPEPDLVLQRGELLRHLEERAALGCPYPAEIADFLRDTSEYEVLTDTAAHLFCTCPGRRQNLLQTLSVHERMIALNAFFTREVKALRLRKQLQGRLGDESVGCN